MKRLASSFHREGRCFPRSDTRYGYGNPSTPDRRGPPAAVQNYLQPQVKIIAANGQSKLPSLVSLELPLTCVDPRSAYRDPSTAQHPTLAIKSRRSGDGLSLGAVTTFRILTGDLENRRSRCTYIRNLQDRRGPSTQVRRRAPLGSTSSPVKDPLAGGRYLLLVRLGVSKPKCLTTHGLQHEIHCSVYSPDLDRNCSGGLPTGGRL